MNRLTLLLILAACDPKPAQPWVISSTDLVWDVDHSGLETNAHGALYWQGLVTRMGMGAPDSIRIDVELRDATGTAVGGGSVMAGQNLPGLHDSAWVFVPTSVGQSAEVCAWVQAGDGSNLPLMIEDLGNCWGMP